jgi:hypothetical protein
MAPTAMLRLPLGRMETGMKTHHRSQATDGSGEAFFQASTPFEKQSQEQSYSFSTVGIGCSSTE